jgi:Cu-Zn family superoxide dismutase
MRIILLTAAAALAAACATAEPQAPTPPSASTSEAPVQAVSPPPVSAPLKKGDGTEIGKVEFTASAHGVLIRVLAGPGALTPGWHGAHLHAIGDCSDAALTKSGAHVKHGGAQHGLLNPNGPEEGDLPNIYATADGSSYAELFSGLVTLPALQDADGSAIIIHASSDDHTTQPIGGAGARVACAVLPK